MLTTSFSVQGVSLKLMRSHEWGVISRIKTIRDASNHKLKKLGLSPGQSIRVEQRSPHFIVRVGNDRHALDEATVNAIYVRIVDH